MRLDTQKTGIKHSIIFQLNYNQNNFYTDFTKDKPMGPKNGVKITRFQQYLNYPEPLTYKIIVGIFFVIAI